MYVLKNTAARFICEMINDFYAVLIEHALQPNEIYSLPMIWKILKLTPCASHALPYEYRAGINSATQTRFIFINLTHRIFDFHHIHGSHFAIVDVFPRNIFASIALCVCVCFYAME